VHAHAYETVVAAQEAGVLNRFVTGMYRTGRDLSSPRLLGVLPQSLRVSVDNRQRRRWHPEIDPAKVSTLPMYHLISLAAKTKVPAWDLEGWAHERFDATVARRLPSYPGVGLVHAWEGAARATFDAAKALGVGRILDVAGAFERNSQVIVEEGGNLPPDDLTVRVQQERKGADYIFVPSQFVVECLVENGVEPDRIVLIPYGADTTRFQPLAHAVDRPFRCLFVGLIGFRKGIRYLLDAWRELDLPDAELVLVGAAGPHGEDLLRERDPSVRWVGQVPFYEVHRWFQESDVFLFPSLSEGSAMVTYQAMAAGLPVVTTLNSGSVVRDGVDGFIVPPRDPVTLAARIRYLQLNPEERSEMGRAGRRRISETFTWGHYRRRIGAAYQAILAGQDPHAAVAPLLASPDSVTE
jgi:glycosyltransferase involved in cell wall biosynthesis